MDHRRDCVGSIVVGRVVVRDRRRRHVWVTCVLFVLMAASYVGDFRLGSADFSYGSHSVLGLPIFFYEEVSTVMRT